MAFVYQVDALNNCHLSVQSSTSTYASKADGNERISEQHTLTHAKPAYPHDNPEWSLYMEHKPAPRLPKSRAPRAPRTHLRTPLSELAADLCHSFDLFQREIFLLSHRHHVVPHFRGEVTGAAASAASTCRASPPPPPSRLAAAEVIG